MKTGTIVGIIAGVVGVGVIAGVAYDESEKGKCAKAGGTWDGILKGCVCPAGTSMVAGVCISNVNPGTTPPATPTNVQVSHITVTGADSWTATASWNQVTGATSYQPMLDGQPYGQPVTATSVQLKGSGVNQTHTFAVEACN